MKKFKKPSINAVQKAVQRVKSTEKYINNSKALATIIKKFPNNTNLTDIYLKVVVLNDLYSTNIYDSFKLAQGIYKLQIDSEIKNNNIKIVNKIAKSHNIKTQKGDKYNFYSFATKYCSWHDQEFYPIFDSYVEKALISYKNSHHFEEFKNSDLKDYKKFIKIINSFVQFFKLNSFDLREVDYFLWYKGWQLKEKGKKEKEKNETKHTNPKY